MNFSSVNALIPRGVEELHSEKTVVAEATNWSVYTLSGGKYGPDDFVVVVTSRSWKDKKLKHSDIFYDVLAKISYNREYMIDWFEFMLGLIKGVREFEGLPKPPRLPGANIRAVTLGMLALSVCEHRRYSQYSFRGGGRYLPINFIGAILEGKWTAEEASDSMRAGLPALYAIGYRPFNHTSNPNSFVNRFRAGE